MEHCSVLFVFGELYLTLGLMWQRNGGDGGDGDDGGGGGDGGGDGGDDGGGDGDGGDGGGGDGGGGGGGDGGGFFLASEVIYTPHLFFVLLCV